MVLLNTGQNLVPLWVHLAHLLRVSENRRAQFGFQRATRRGNAVARKSQLPIRTPTTQGNFETKMSSGREQLGADRV